MPDRLKKMMHYAVSMLIWMALLPWATLKYGKKHVWLICERGTDARDNGYHMFRYLREKHPEVNAWYIITRDSQDMGKVAPLGNVVVGGSLRHWMLFITADKILTAFENHYSPSKSYKFTQFIKRKNHQALVFLQHGVIANDLPLYHRERSGFDLFICGAKPEYDFVSSHFHYTNGEVRYTGLARFDALHHASVKRQLLIMPTYRKWFRGQTKDEVAHSQYVRLWQAVLDSPWLAAAAEKYDYQVIFFPHQLMQQYIGLFHTSNERITIADFCRYDVQPLLKDSAVLITDYSSVHFDFAYMRKPVVYYQFDEQEMFEKHCARGYFDYPTMGFGDVVATEDQLRNSIEACLANDCQLTPAHENRIGAFFPLHDRRNCERIYNEVVKAAPDGI